MEPRHLHPPQYCYGGRVGGYETLKEPPMNLGLRAVYLAYADPFTKKRVEIHAPTENFLKEYGFAVSGEERDKGWAARRRPTT
jgi:hypothetical protein